MPEFCGDHNEFKTMLHEIRTDTIAIRRCLQGDLQHPETGVMSRIGLLELWKADMEYEATQRAEALQKTKAVVFKTVFDWAVKLAVMSAAAKFGIDWLKSA